MTVLLCILLCTRALWVARPWSSIALRELLALGTPMLCDLYGCADEIWVPVSFSHLKSFTSEHLQKQHEVLLLLDHTPHIPGTHSVWYNAMSQLSHAV